MGSLEGLLGKEVVEPTGNGQSINRRGMPLLGAQPAFQGCRSWCRSFGDLHQVLVSNALAQLSDYKQDFSFCHELNVSICPVSQNSEHFLVTVYNPLGRKVHQMVRLPVREGLFTVKNPNGKTVPSNVSLYSESSTRVPASRVALSLSVFRGHLWVSPTCS